MNQDTNPLAIVFALREEIKPLLKESMTLSQIRIKSTILSKSVFRGTPVIFCQTGIGMNHAHEGVERLIETCHPSLILSAGYAGATESTLRTGDLLLTSEIRSEAGDSFRPDPEGRGLLEELIREEQLAYRSSPLLTRWKMANRGEKMRLGQSGVIAVDMETAAAAAVASKMKTPFLSLRAVFDTLEDEIPFGDPVADESRPLQFLIKNPKSILSIPKFFRMNQVCQRNLSRVLARFIDCFGR